MNGKRLCAVFGRFNRAATLALVCMACLYGASGPMAAADAPGTDKQAEKIVPRMTREACPDVSAGRAKCLSDVSLESYDDPQEAVQPYASGGYGPSEFHTAYQIPCKPGGPIDSVCDTPSSYGPETIAIVNAGGYNGSLEADLQAYNDQYGLPDCTVANGCLTIVNQDGDTSPLPPEVNSGWRFEMALDVQTAHMICQTCKIVLVQADDDFVDSMSAAEETAASFAPIAISNSWGADVDVPAFDNYYKRTGMAVVAATGDDGTVTSGQSWPADIPEVLAAAGTTLQLNTDDTWASETVWSGSGGGCSANYAAPSWQTSHSDWASQGCSGGGRAFGDVSAAADPATGAAIVVNSSWYIIGGTSLATPLIAGMYALGSDIPAGTTAVSLPYQNITSYNYRDITSGDDCTAAGQPNCTAAVGFDVPSGLGAPRGLGLFQADPAAPTTYAVQLSPGEEISPGETLGSSSTYPPYRMILQGDGNLVVYKPNGKPSWSSRTKNASRLVLQGDGNLVLYDSNGNAVWNSDTRTAIRLVMQGDGNLVLYDSSNRAVWSIYTGKISYATYTSFNAGQTLDTYQSLGSVPANPTYKLILQGDGNLVVYKKGGKAIWQSRSAGTGSNNRLVLQGDGNLVLYKGGKALWNSGTAGTGSNNRLVMQGDGNLVLYKGAKALWSSYTGRIR